MRDVIDRYAALPFDYTSDCCRFAADCVEAVTGRNPMQRVKYKTERQAYAIIKQHGGLRGLLIYYLGAPARAGAKARDGDVCLIDANDGREAAAMVYKNRIVARVESGLMDYPLNRAKLLWTTSRA